MVVGGAFQEVMVSHPAGKSSKSSETLTKGRLNPLAICYKVETPVRAVLM